MAPDPNRRTLTHIFAPWNGGSDRIWTGLSEIEEGSTSNLHSHPNEEILYVLEGAGEIEVDGVRYPVEPGSSVRVAPDRPHRLFNGGEGLLRVLCTASPAFERSVFDAAHDLDDPAR
ncbi:MAG: cupin domain-containing protein [Actinobacteria bacterium]|nr:cupin domain-containing protein [Actinomycetota bacterium]